MTKEVLKLALEALEADELDMVDDGSGNMVFRKEQAITTIKEALAQPKQEPLAWISTGPASMIHWTADKPAYGDDWVPLYTTPPPCPTCEALARTVMMDQRTQVDKNEDSSNNALLQRTLGDADQLHDQCGETNVYEYSPLHGVRRVS